MKDDSTKTDTTPSEPLAQFYRLLPTAQPPRRADRAAGGLIPTRAFRYCEAMCSASAFGWYVFPPMNFRLMWDGTDTRWTFEGADGWYNLDAAQYPDFYDVFNAACPEAVADHAPPLVAAGAEPGIVNIWSGLIARTRPGWSLLVRPPANLPRSARYENYEGLIETDSWFGPLFTNIRLTSTDVPIDFRIDMPFLQVQPIHRSLYDIDVLSSFDFVDDITKMNAQDWRDYHATVIAPGTVYERERGYYAKSSRRRNRSPAGACPLAGG